MYVVRIEPRLKASMIAFVGDGFEPMEMRSTVNGAGIICAIDCAERSKLNSFGQSAITSTVFAHESPGTAVRAAILATIPFASSAVRAGMRPMASFGTPVFEKSANQSSEAVFIHFVGSRRVGTKS